MRVQTTMIHLNGGAERFRRAMLGLEKIDFANRFWNKDATLWKQNPDHQKIIQNSLGWLTVVGQMQEKIEELMQFSKEIKESGFEDVLLLGMGGSSLAPELFRQCLPKKKGYPKFWMLDSTDPVWIGRIERSISLEKTLFIFASKSGTTIEPLSFFHYFYHRAGKRGSQFIAITDPGTFLEKLAKELKFRRVFLNPPDIGGRFSALSYFGLVPASLMGINAERLLASAQEMLESCKAGTPILENPAVQLGVVLAESAKIGRNKATLILPERLHALGLWVEQLVAESSGKEGNGIVPIAGEALSIPQNYSPDRLFVFVSLKRPSPSIKKRMKTLSKASPVVHLQMDRPEDLGGELIRWEIATAVACSSLGVNAFDQPDVQSAKEQTKLLLTELTEKGSIPNLPVHFQNELFKVSFSRETLKNLDLQSLNFSDLLKLFLNQLKPCDYVGILAYFPFKKETDHKLSRIRTWLRDQTKCATLFGYGPRYLHSTGQLHKGGDNSGLFFVLTTDHDQELQVPEFKYSFNQLETAQAIGDFKALDAKGRRAMRIHLKSPLVQSLNELTRSFVRP